MCTKKAVPLVHLAPILYNVFGRCFSLSIFNIFSNLFGHSNNNSNSPISYDDSSNSAKKKYKVLEKYSEFPEYPGKIKNKPYETITDKYNRVTIMYKGSVDSTYYRTLENYGYIKGSDVRFDKNNTYVIVEPHRERTKIVYHVKK